VTLCIDILRTFSCIIRVFYSFVLLTVHLCAIVTRFNKCNLFTYLLYFRHNGLTCNKIIAPWVKTINHRPMQEIVARQLTAGPSIECNLTLSRHIGLSVRVPGGQKLQMKLNPIWHRMLHVATVGVK